MELSFAPGLRIGIRNVVAAIATSATIVALAYGHRRYGVEER